jgi:hypothetical protein
MEETIPIQITTSITHEDTDIEHETQKQKNASFFYFSAFQNKLIKMKQKEKGLKKNKAIKTRK